MKLFPIVLGLLAASLASAQQYTISTFAGIGPVPGYYPYPGLDPVPANQAQFYSPGALAVDSTGNLFVADYLSYVIWEVTGGNVDPPVVGTNSPGNAGDDGPGILATIYKVQGLAIDSSDNLYIADSASAVVRVFNVASGQINLFAGNGSSGNSGDGGSATSASVTSPSGLAVDSAGNVYIADYGSHSVRKVSGGKISTIAGNGNAGYSGDGGPAAQALLGSPVALAIDSSGNLFISDFTNANIREITTDGNIRTVASHVAAEALAIDSGGNLYYPDYIHNTVEKILPNGSQYTIAGNGVAGFAGDGGPATSAQFNFTVSYGITVDSSGNIYVADSGNGVVRKLTPVGSSLTVVSSASGVGSSIAPGEIVSLFGPNLGAPTALTAVPDANGYYGTEIAGTEVLINYQYPLPLLYVSPNQINAIVPYAVASLVGGTTTATVYYQGQQVAIGENIPVTASALSLFTLGSTGTGQAAAVNQDGTINGPLTPAKQGSVISLYLTGEGQTIPAGVDGKPASMTDISLIPKPVDLLTVLLSGQPSEITYQGGAPGNVAGLMQLNVRIPASLLQNPSAGVVAVPVQIHNSSAFVYPGVTISVAP